MGMVEEGSCWEIREDSMAGVGARAPQQEITGTFGRWWTSLALASQYWQNLDPQRYKEGSENIFPMSPTVATCVLTGSLAYLFSLSFPCTQVSWHGQVQRGHWAQNKGKPDLVLPFHAHTETGHKDRWERLSATPAPYLVLGPGLLLQGGKRKDNVRLGQRNILCFWPFPGEGPWGLSV